MTDNGHLNELERLVKLRESGDLTAEEFAQQKAKIMSAGNKVPIYRRLWFVVTLTCLVITFPLSLLILATGDVYKNSKSEGLQPISARARYVYAGALVLWILALVVRAAVDPQSTEQAWNSNAVDAGQAHDSSAVAEVPKQPIACDSAEAADEVKAAIENGATSQLVAMKVEDFGRATELYLDKRSNIRFCQADAVLNTGATPISYMFFFGPSGKEMVQVKQGADAFVVEKIKALEAVGTAMDRAVQAKHVQATTADAQSQNSNVQTAGSDQATRSTNARIPDDSSESMDSYYSPTYNQCIKDHGGEDISQADTAGCLESELSFQVTQLNNTYASYKAQLDPTAQIQLQDKERVWIKLLQTQCSDNGSTVDTGNAAELAQPSCELDMTIQRRLRLEQMQKSSGGN